MKTGQVFRNGKLVSETYAFDPRSVALCWRHPNILAGLDNKDNPTDRDKKKVDSIRFRPSRTIDKNGKVQMGRSCPKCFQYIKLEPGIAKKPSLEINIDEVSEEITQANSLG